MQTSDSVDQSYLERAKADPLGFGLLPHISPDERMPSHYAVVEAARVLAERAARS